MNVKNKIVAFVMSFVICFCTVSSSFCNDKERVNNINPLVVDGGVISVPMLATVSSIAVGTGLIIKNNDEIYNIGKMFYDYVKNHNQLTWDFVQSAFIAGHTVINNYVHVNSDFLTIVKDFLNSRFGSSTLPIGYYYDMPIYNTKTPPSDSNYFYIDFSLFDVGYNGTLLPGIDFKISSKVDGVTKVGFITAITRNYELTGTTGLFLKNIAGGTSYTLGIKGRNVEAGSLTLDSTMTAPTGVFDWDKLKDRIKDEKVALPVPSDLGTLVNKGADDFWSNGSDLVGTGGITLPQVSNPSIDVTDDVFIGGTVVDPPLDTPVDSPFSAIKEFIISLVVPSDTFWTDTFNGFRDNLNKNFPMLDMTKFDSLVVGGKPFPNIYAYGSKIVDGDVINSIVDWLRPIIAGFIMICLMLFNYRKIYKLIRNTEPFGGIAPGSSEFSTGLRDSDYRQTVREFRAYMAREGGGK